jgi:tetratricopeptide (TPR) repeat protein
VIGRHALAISVCLCAALASGQSWAQAQVSAECKKPRRDPGMMSEGLYHQLETATELVAKNKNAEAIEKFQKMAQNGGDYEKAVVYYNMGFAYNAMNRLDEALKTFEKALSYHSLPIPQEEQLTFNVGQLYVANGQFDEGIRVLQNYIATACATVAPEAHIFLGNAYAEKKRFAEALKEVDLAMDTAKEPKESWLQLKLALHYELKQMPKCAETLLRLIAIAPAKPDYWKQLSGILFDLKQDKDSLAVLALAGNQGFLKTGAEYKNLASIYLLLEIPYKAGTLLQDAIDKKLLPADEKNLDLLSAAWINARDTARAEAALKKLAAVADKGDYYMRLGYVYIESERWKEAVATLEKARQTQVHAGRAKRAEVRRQPQAGQRLAWLPAPGTSQRRQHRRGQRRARGKGAGEEGGCRAEGSRAESAAGSAHTTAAAGTFRVASTTPPTASEEIVRTRSLWDDAPPGL